MTTKNIARSTKDNLISLASLLALLLFFSFGSYFVNVLAQTPPDGNIAAPINTGDASQTKSGFLSVIGGVSLGSNGMPALLSDQSSSETLLFFEQGSNLRIREHGAANSVVTVSSGVVGINNSNPNPEADLDIVSKGIRLGGLTRNEWPRWATDSVSYTPNNGDVYECPRGSVMTGIRIEHGSGDKEYIGRVFCRSIYGMYAPEIPPDPEPDGRICFTDEDGVERCKVPAN